MRLSYSKNPVTGAIVTEDKNDYYPFGLNFITNVFGGGALFSPVTTFKNWKFLSSELQEVGFYDLQNRIYFSDILIFGQHDPLSEKTLQPYAYGYGNPVRFADPSGLKGDDVIIRGGAANNALNDLQKSVSSELTLNMDSNGKVSYTQNDPKAKLSSDSQQLVNAIDDHSVVVNVQAENTIMTSNKSLSAGGAFMGNSIGFDSSLNLITNAYQEINPFALTMMNTYFDKPGANTLHEVTEAYQGAKLSQRLGISYLGPAVSNATEFSNERLIYDLAHNLATPQVGGYTTQSYDKDGKDAGGRFYKGGRIDFILNKTGKSPFIYQTYHIPK